MKKGLFKALFACLIIFTLSFSLVACSKPIIPKDFDNSMTYEKIDLSNISIKEIVSCDKYYNMLYISVIDEYVLYNVKANKLICDSVNRIEKITDNVYLVDRGDKVVYYLGDKSFTFNDVVEYKIISNGIILDNTVYIFDSYGVVKEITSIDKDLSDITNINVYVTEYGYMIDNNFYDVDGNLLYNVESKFVGYDDEEVVYYILANGNVIRQSYLELPSDSKTYDVIYSGKKIKLTTQLLNIKNQKVSKINLNFIIKNVSNKLVDIDYNYGVENLFKIAKIKDHRVVNTTLVGADNKGKIVLDFDKIAKQVNHIKIIDNEKYLIGDAYGIYRVVDKNNNTKLAVNMPFIMMSKSYYVVNDNTYYDMNTGEKCVVKGEIIDVTDSAVFYQKQGVTYMKKDGKVTKIDNYFSADTRFDFYITRDLDLFSVIDIKTGNKIIGPTRDFELLDMDGDKFTGFYDGRYLHVYSLKY